MSDKVTERGLAHLRQFVAAMEADTAIWYGMRNELRDIADEVEEEEEDMEREKISPAERRVLDIWPRFEDGAPVMPGDQVRTNGCDAFARGITFPDPGLRPNLGFSIFTDPGTVGFYPGQRVRRPSVRDKSGAPIEVGDTVRDDGGECWRVREIVWKDGKPLLNLRRNEIICWDYQDPNYFVKVEPDNQGRIDADAEKPMMLYWGCANQDTCDECPARIDGKTPKERYGVDLCECAKALDLLRRQRELDGAKPIDGKEGSDGH